MKAIWSLATVVLVAGCVDLRAQTPDARRLGEEVLYEALLGAKKFIVVVASNGCTDKSSFRLETERKQGPGGAPHYLITLKRIRVDECKMVPTRQVLAYDLEQDLGISGNCTYTLANRTFSGSPAEESLLSIVLGWFGLGEASAGPVVVQGTPEVPGRAAQPAPDDVQLRTGLRKALLFALESELQRYKQRGDEEAARRVAAWLDQYRDMRPEDFPLPRGEGAEGGPGDWGSYGPVVPPLAREVEVIVSEPFRLGSILEVVGMTRSGPFYHLAGIAGEDLAALKPASRVRLALSLVYKREYFGFIPDYYVYVMRVE